jgi:hypothetical protein
MNNLAEEEEKSPPVLSTEETEGGMQRPYLQTKSPFQGAQGIWGSPEDDFSSRYHPTPHVETPTEFAAGVPNPSKEH